MSGIEASAINQIVAGFIAAVLYGAAYLSLVRALRFPRNWLDTPPATIIVTVLLAVLAVAHVSISSVGLEPVSLALSAGFIGVMYFVVAAPSFAFRRANRAIEFLAKHGEHAGLWLLGPALIAGLTVPNIKLQALLAMAMAIELSWFARQRWATRRRRRLYRLSGRDLAVLETQAGGDLKIFRDRHAIHELELREGAVEWRGCGKDTPPCPFNLYVNRLGLNTAPCCREHMRDIAQYTAACLREIGAVHWLEGGSLLGAVREHGALLDWEDDIDISVLLDADMTWEKLSAGLAERCARDGYHIELFERETLIGLSFDAPKSWPNRWERSRLRGEIRVDIALYRAAVSHGVAVLERRSYKGAMTHTESGGYGLPQDIVLPTSTIDFLDGNIACPNNPEAYLRVLYGDYEKVEYTYVDPVAAETRRQADMAKAP
jgi:hypothetical protein